MEMMRSHVELKMAMSRLSSTKYAVARKVQKRMFAPNWMFGLSGDIRSTVAWPVSQMSISESMLKYE